jgi:hypothetical protein
MPAMGMPVVASWGDGLVAMGGQRGGNGSSGGGAGAGWVELTSPHDHDLLRNLSLIDVFRANAPLAPLPEPVPPHHQHRTRRTTSAPPPPPGGTPHLAVGASPSTAASPFAAALAPAAAAASPAAAAAAAAGSGGCALGGAAATAHADAPAGAGAGASTSVGDCEDDCADTGEPAQWLTALCTSGQPSPLLGRGGDGDGPSSAATSVRGSPVGSVRGLDAALSPPRSHSRSSSESVGPIWQEGGAWGGSGGGAGAGAGHTPAGHSRIRRQLLAMASMDCTDESVGVWCALPTGCVGTGAGDGGRLSRLPSEATGDPLDEFAY